jgi:hypothetical protein
MWRSNVFLVVMQLPLLLLKNGVAAKSGDILLFSGIPDNARFAMMIGDVEARAE